MKATQNKHTSVTKKPHHFTLQGHGILTPCPLKGRQGGAEVSFHKNIMDNFMAYQYRLETYLLELIARPENSEWFSVVVF